MPRGAHNHAVIGFVISSSAGKGDIIRSIGAEDL
jgi:hypothetical protein